MKRSLSRQSNPQHPLQKQLEDFQQALGDTLIGATAVEVNTVIVSEITAAKFNPGETYQEILQLNSAYLEQNIHESLRDRYHQLQQQLQRDYRGLLSHPTSNLYNPNPPSSLPTQGDLKQQLLSNPHFLRSLRKLAEVKAILDRRNQSLLTPSALPNPYDLIFAQTVTQLDGDIFHRYATELLDHPQQDLILQLHRTGVTSSDQQWRGLLRFLLQIAQTLVG
jgi:hypothetical protein